MYVICAIYEDQIWSNNLLYEVFFWDWGYLKLKHMLREDIKESIKSFKMNQYATWSLIIIWKLFEVNAK